MRGSGDGRVNPGTFGERNGVRLGTIFLMARMGRVVAVGYPHHPLSGVSPIPQKPGPKPREKASEAQSGARMEIGGGWDRPRNSRICFRDEEGKMVYR